MIFYLHKTLSEITLVCCCIRFKFFFFNSVIVCSFSTLIYIHFPLEEKKFTDVFFSFCLYICVCVCVYTLKLRLQFLACTESLFLKPVPGITGLKGASEQRSHNCCRVIDRSQIRAIDTCIHHTPPSRCGP